jgi:hypothetical protein
MRNEPPDQSSVSLQALSSENAQPHEPIQVNPPPEVSSTPEVVEESKTRTVNGIRRDKGRTHYSRHGLLSRDVERALVQFGEPIRNIRRWERKFRSALRPRGEVAHLLFDKWWSCYLRQLLIAKLEANAFAPDNSHRVSSNLPVLEERTQPTLVWPSENESDENLRPQPPDDLFHRLAVIQRYDAHYSREGNRMLALLLLMRDGNEDTLAKIFSATLGVSK